MQFLADGTGADDLGDVIDREAASSGDEAARSSHDGHLATTIFIEWSKTDALCFEFGNTDCRDGVG
jgi:hypothetical protein